MDDAPTTPLLLQVQLVMAIYSNRFILAVVLRVVRVETVVESFVSPPSNFGWKARFVPTEQQPTPTQQLRVVPVEASGFKRMPSQVQE